MVYLFASVSISVRLATDNLSVGRIRTNVYCGRRANGLLYFRTGWPGRWHQVLLGQKPELFALLHWTHEPSLLFTNCTLFW